MEDITSGTLKIDGRVVNDVEPADRDIAMVFQTYALYPHMTVYDKYGTSFGFPASAMGAHVSACPNEVNGRETPITTRGIVAMQGGAASATSSICSSFLSAPASTSAIR